MKKKLLAGLVMLMTSAPFAAFAHGLEDKYDAMCQSTGPYHTTKYAYEDYAKNKQYLLLHLWGHCGEQPNYLEYDFVRPATPVEKKKIKGSVDVHHIDFWASPKKDDLSEYWTNVFSKIYYTDASGKVLKDVKADRDFTKVLVIKEQDLSNFIITERISAKVGGPLFDSALGPIPMVRGSEEEGLIERGYLDYKKINKDI